MYQPRTGWDQRKGSEGSGVIDGNNFVTKGHRQVSQPRDTWVNSHYPLPPKPDHAGSSSQRRNKSPVRRDGRDLEAVPVNGEYQDYGGRRSRSPEPGQITSPGRTRRGSRERGHHYRGKRSRGNSPVRDGSVTDALETFSRTMHSVLILTSQQALAKTYLARVQSFPSSSESPTLLDAQDKLHYADRDLSDGIISLHDAFVELMRRTVNVTGKGEIVDIGGLELDGLKDRIKKLERATPSQAPSSPIVPAPPLPPTLSPPAHDSDVQMSDTKGKGKVDISEGQRDKRLRARALLNEVLERLEVVEGMKDSLEMRCDELEDLIWQQNEELCPPAMTWGRLESVRSAPKPLKSLRKRKRVLDEQAEQEGWDSLERSRDPDGKLRGEEGFTALAGKEDMAQAGPVDETTNNEVQALKEQVAALQRDLQELMETKRVGMANVTQRAVVENMREEIAIITKQEIHRMSLEAKQKFGNGTSASQSRPPPATVSQIKANPQYPNIDPYQSVPQQPVPLGNQLSQPSSQTPAQEMIQAAAQAVVKAAGMEGNGLSGQYQPRTVPATSSPTSRPSSISIPHQQQNVLHPVLLSPHNIAQNLYNGQTLIYQQPGPSQTPLGQYTGAVHTTTVDTNRHNSISPINSTPSSAGYTQGVPAVNPDAYNQPGIGFSSYNPPSQSLPGIQQPQGLPSTPQQDLPWSVGGNQIPQYFGYSGPPQDAPLPTPPSTAPGFKLTNWNPNNQNGPAEGS